MSQKTADVLVIGGGVAGLSTALQLARRGKSVIVLERGQLGSGSTGRAAGLLGQLRGTAASTRMLMDGVETVRELEKETGEEIFLQTGSLRVAATPDRAQEIVDLVEMGKSIDFDIQHLTCDEVHEKLPYMKTEDLLDACYCPTDGHLQPAELVASYVKWGRKLGVQYQTQTPVERVLIEGGRAVGVQTASGPLYADAVVNAGGPWSYLVAEMAATVLPTAAIGHVYLTTRPDDAILIDRFSPGVRDRENRIYSRPEAGGLIVGMYEAEPEQYEMENLPVDFDMALMKAARDDIHVAMLIYCAQQRFPWINERTPMTVTTGIMTFSPDGKAFCGAFDALSGFFHCSGFSGHGIVQSPTIGVIMADLVTEGKTDYDLSEIEADRFYEHPGYLTRNEIRSRCFEMAGNYYGRVEGKTAGGKAS